MMMETAVGVQRVAFFIVLVTAFQVAVARFDLHQEARRRWQHALTGHALVQISYLLPVAASLAALLIGATGIYCIRHYRDDIYVKAFGPLLRQQELQEGHLPGAFYFLIGTAFTLALFPISDARYSVECLAWADPMAAWVGCSVASPKINQSASLAGCLACFVTAWGIGWIMLLLPKEDAAAADFGRVTLGALACCIAEALPFGNDNLLIPLLTAAAVQDFR